MKLTAFVVAVLTLVTGVGTAAYAAPDSPDGNDSQKLNSLRANLATAAEGYLKAEAEFAASKAKQQQGQEALAAAEADMARVRARISTFAAEAYRTGRITPVALMLQATSAEDFVGRAQMLDRISRSDVERMDDLAEAKDRAAQAKAAIDAAVTAQAAAVQELAKRKLAAEKALASASAQRANVDTSGAATAKPAPRNPDGTWPGESCSIDDPTTGGCVTPRTLHALQQAKNAGFQWYVSCYRPGDKYEHPKGRACDFATNESGFVNRSASGDYKAYGDRLAAFFVKNAKSLGVMYVVWYCQIWQYGAGWHRYNSAGSTCGDQPAPDHTNHVHLSVY